MKRYYLPVLLIACLAACKKGDNKPANFTKVEHTGITYLAKPSAYMTSAANGNKIFFAAGHDASSFAGKHVDIYDVSTGTWSQSELSSSRNDVAGGSVGNKVLFAGGRSSDEVDIYDVSKNNWSTAKISDARNGMVTARAGNKLFFGGGWYGSGLDSKTVDIYDAAQGSWSIALLSQPRNGLAAAAAGNKVLFAGGHSSRDSRLYLSKQVDIYDLSTGNWASSELSQARDYLSAAASGNKIVFAGGRIFAGNGSGIPVKTVEIYDISTGLWKMATLSEARYGMAVAVSGNIILFAGGSVTVQTCSKTVDIYNALTDSWSTAQLSEARTNLSAAAAGNKVLVAGGTLSGATVIVSKTVDVFTLSK